MTDPVAWFDAEALAASRWGELIEGPLERALQAIAADRFPHALMLVGPEGMGRELLAVRLAAALTCPDEGGADCTCAACGRVRRGIHPDVVAVFPRREGASGRVKKFVDIGQIRELVDSAPSRPYEARARVWILSSAEAGGIGVEAANAFLKLLEEPPAHVRFVLLAANPDLVMPTIRSRCQTLYLPGAVASAARTGDGGLPPELVGSGLEPESLAAVFALADASLRGGLRGELLPLLSLAARLEAEVAAHSSDATQRRERMARAFEVVASAAVELAVDPAAEAGEATARLGGELLLQSRRVRELNLDPERQLVASLLAWQREAGRSRA